MMKNKYIMTINVLFIVICITALFGLYFTNKAVIQVGIIL